MTTPEPVNLTPPSTAVRGMGPQVIVDVSLDANGEQVYSVHDITALGNSAAMRSNSNAAAPDRATPTQTGMASPRSTERKRVLEVPQFDLKRVKLEEQRSEEDDDSEIWSQDVQDAFVEALEIIPKKGLNKIKVSGRSCGRNELISDFIRTKTGKIRTRKQVSSHIQVIKNMKKDPRIIDLIKNGPSDSKSVKNFDDVFSSITFAKSMGNNKIDDVSSVKKLVQPPHAVNPDFSKLDMSLAGFQMSYLYDNITHTLSTLRPHYMDPPLRIKENANISKRFPDLYELVSSMTQSLDTHSLKHDSPPVPIMHGMVKLNIPLTQDLVSGQYAVSSDLSMTGFSDTDQCWCVYTIVYSFGRSVVSTFEKLDPRFQDGSVHFKIRLASDYWNALFHGVNALVKEQLTKGSVVKPFDELVNNAVRGITVQQCVFIADSQDMKRDMKKLTLNLDDIERHKIRSVLLWEFCKTNEDAVTSMRRIYPPKSLYDKFVSPAVSNQELPQFQFQMMQQQMMLQQQQQQHTQFSQPSQSYVQTISPVSMGEPAQHYYHPDDIPGAPNVQIKSEDDVKLDDYFW